MKRECRFFLTLAVTRYVSLRQMRRPLLAVSDLRSTLSQSLAASDSWRQSMISSHPL